MKDTPIKFLVDPIYTIPVITLLEKHGFEKKDYTYYDSTKYTKFTLINYSIPQICFIFHLMGYHSLDIDIL